MTGRNEIVVVLKNGHQLLNEGLSLFIYLLTNCNKLVVPDIKGIGFKISFQVKIFQQFITLLQYFIVPDNIIKILTIELRDNPVKVFPSFLASLQNQA